MRSLSRSASSTSLLKVLVIFLGLAAVFVSAELDSSAYFTPIAGGVEHSLALRPDGTLVAWGSNNGGQLGLIEVQNTTVPLMVEFNQKWSFVTGGYHNSFGIAEDGSLWSFGDNNYNQLGYTKSRKAPSQVGEAKDWVAIAAGLKFTLGLKKNGSLYAWGDGYRGQLGTGKIEESETPVQVAPRTTWKAIAAGERFSYGIMTDGSLHTWGEHYRVGEIKSSPFRIGTKKNWKDVKCGTCHAMALNEEGELYSWGENSYGQLGDGKNDPYRPEPRLVNIPPTDSVDLQPSTSSKPSKGPIKAIGSKLKTLVSRSPRTKWASMSVGREYSMAITVDGDLYGWGHNNHGQLGDGSTTDRFYPVKIGEEYGPWSYISAHFWHTLGVTSTGAVYSWGNVSETGDNSLLPLMKIEPISSNTKSARTVAPSSPKGNDNTPPASPVRSSSPTNTNNTPPSSPKSLSTSQIVRSPQSNAIPATPVENPKKSSTPAPSSAGVTDTKTKPMIPPAATAASASVAKKDIGRKLLKTWFSN